jgi:hypothetical protein
MKLKFKQQAFQTDTVKVAVDCAEGRDRVAYLQGTFGYPLSASDPLTTLPMGLPAGVIRATTLIAAAGSGEFSIERVGLDGQRVSVSSTGPCLSATAVSAAASQSDDHRSGNACSGSE